MNVQTLLLTCLLVVAAGLATMLYGLDQPRAPVRTRWGVRYVWRSNAETQMRARFLTQRPDEKPLNWAIGEVAQRFHRNQPMGKFVLHQNDCSDFVECVIDEALGARARFKRGSNFHSIGLRTDVFDSWYWQPGEAVQPGDVISVEHSPWYTPYEGAIWHVGVVGADGAVYDFTKLRRWRQARYGRNTFEWFVRHSNYFGGVIVSRLKSEYRYKVR